MKVAIIYNENAAKVINKFGMQNREFYKPATIKRVTSALEAGGHNVITIDGDMNVIEKIHDFMPQVMEGEKMGMVFNMAYGIQGESRYTHIPAMLEMLGIPYVGSSPAGHTLALDKVVTKMILQQHGISTPDFWVINSVANMPNDVKFPVIVKPKMESVSFGLRVVDNYKDLTEAVDFIVTEFQQAALVEQFIPGREFAVGLLGNSPVESFPVLEIDLENDPNGIQTVENKMGKVRQKICPANLSEEKAREFAEMSIQAFQALQLRDFARVDFRMDKDGKIYILELNSMASLGETGSYPHAAKVAGFNFDMLVNRILDVAAERYFTKPIFEQALQKNSKKLPLEVKLRSFLRNKESNIEKLLKELVNVNTYIRNVDGVNQVSNLIKKQLSQLGFQYNSLDQVEVGNSLFFCNTDDGNYDYLFLANLDNDTKPINHKFFSTKNNKIFGTGVWENKGGIALLISTLQALRFTRHLRKLKIGILLTTDDTLQGKYSSKFITSYAHQAKYVIGLHGAFINGGLVTSRSGAAVYSCNATLKDDSDASTVSQAVGYINRLLASWSDLSQPEDGLIVSPANVSMETNITDPYAKASVHLSVRFNRTEQMEELDKKIRKLILPKYNKIMAIQFEGGIRRPSMHKSEAVMQFWNEIKETAAKLDINLREEHRWSSADICFIDSEKHLIDGFGPAGAKPANHEEYILKHSLIERITLLAATLINSVE